MQAPPSKSAGHRFLIACALCDGESVVRGISESDDMLATLDCLRALGATVEKDGTTVKISHGNKTAACDWVSDCRESGSTLRFFIPIALARTSRASFVCAPRLVERGVSVYEETLGKKGICFEKDKNEIRVFGSLKSGEYIVRGDESSQYISGLLFALPLLEGDSTLTVTGNFESRAYVDMTVCVLRRFGIEIAEKGNVFEIKGGQKYQSGTFDVEGDWSNGAALLALNEVGGNVQVKGLDENSVQGDKICKEYFARLDKENVVLDVANCPDLAPILMSVASFKKGVTLENTRRLRIKESDRAQAMSEELAKFGVATEVKENSVVVKAAKLEPPKIAIDGHNDHRIVMATSVLLSRVGGEIIGCEAVKKSYPSFFEDLAKAGVQYDVE